MAPDAPPRAGAGRPRSALRGRRGAHGSPAVIRERRLESLRYHLPMSHAPPRRCYHTNEKVGREYCRGSKGHETFQSHSAVWAVARRARFRDAGGRFRSERAAGSGRRPAIRGGRYLPDRAGGGQRSDDGLGDRRSRLRPARGRRRPSERRSDRHERVAGYQFGTIDSGWHCTGVRRRDQRRRGAGRVAAHRRGWRLPPDAADRSRYSSHRPATRIMR